MEREGLRKKDPDQIEREKLWERKQQEMLATLPEIEDTQFVFPPDQSQAD
jgi:hypothetical protein